MDTTPRQRVWQAVRHVQPDRVPFHFSYTQLARQKLEDYYGTKDLDRALDNQIVKFKPRPPDIEESPGLWRDEFGILWDRRADPDIGVVQEYLLKERSLSGFSFPDPADPRRYAGFQAFIDQHPDRFRVVNLGKSLFERAWMLRGLPELMVDMLEAPAFVEELLEAILSFNLQIIAVAASADIDAVMFGDDWAHQNGLMFSPRLWNRFIRPRIAPMYAAVHAAGKAVFIHCCGKAQSLFPELIELGVDVFNPFQPEAMDPYLIKRQYGQALCFYGGMSVQRLLPYGKPQQVRDEARRLMDSVGQGGGFIIAPSHDMPGDIPLENMVAFIEAVREA